MKLFFTYLRQRRRVLGLLALFAAIFFSIFALYHLPMKAVAYPALGSGGSFWCGISCVCGANTASCHG